ncbi:MAG: hypothetical protein WC969_10880 [Elusimicrobiota bacterium]|jgi:hypothetical protein
MIPLRSALTEAAVLAVFLGGIAVSRALKRRWSAPEVVLMCSIGLLFELLTAHWWNYRNIFILIPTPIDDDISALFPLGWAGLMMIATPVAERLRERWGLARWWQGHLVMMGVWLVVGSISEATFNAIGMIEYVDRPQLRLLLGQLPGLPPTIYMVGYAFLPALIAQIFRWLERSLKTP